MQKIDWIDVLDIAIELYDKFPEVDPQWISFPDLHQKVCGLENFVGDPKRSRRDLEILENISLEFLGDPT